MQCSAVKKQIAMLDMDTPPSCLLSLISAPFWSCLEKNKKNGLPKPKQKFYVTPFIKNELQSDLLLSKTSPRDLSRILSTVAAN